MTKREYIEVQRQYQPMVDEMRRLRRSIDRLADVATAVTYFEDVVNV